MATRKNIRSLSPTEKSDLITAIKAVKTAGNYDAFVDAHANVPMTNIHSCPAFLPWHRRLILDLELEIQSVSGDSNLGLPYWNWAEDMADLASGVLSDLKDAPMWASDLMGGNGDAGDGNKVKGNPFGEGNWDTVDAALASKGALRRSMGVEVSDLPTQAQVNAALAITEYDAPPWNRTATPSFRNQLEGWRPSADAPGLHNRGHVWIGGDMEDVPTAPNDPAFFLHHCFVDKIWADWQVRHGVNNYLGRPDQQPSDNMEPTPSGTHPIQSTFDISALGYTYDTMVPASSSGGGSDSCLFSAVALGTSLEPSLHLMRELRDVLCASSHWGRPARRATDWYYRLSPGLIREMDRSEAIFLMVKYGAVLPVMHLLKRWKPDH